ncbi:hypothetical protein As57867_004551, partial [Aphanomyces stellatus]
MVSCRLLVGAAILATSALAQTCSIEKNVDYEGNDIASTEQENHEDCCADCQDTPGCKAYNWESGVCYLKSKKGRSIRAPGTVSGVLTVATPAPTLAPTPAPKPSSSAPSTCSVIPNVDYDGNDITTTEQDDYRKCCADCQATKGCKLYNWFEGVCYLKSKQGRSSPLEGSYSGILSTTPAPTPKPTPVPTPAPTPAP